MDASKEEKDLSPEHSDSSEEWMVAAADMDASKEEEASLSEHSNSSEEWMVAAAESESNIHGTRAEDVVATTSGISIPTESEPKLQISDTVSKPRQGGAKMGKSGRPKPFFYKDTLADSGDSDADSESSEPDVKIYPANSSVLTCRPGTSSGESFDGRDDQVVAPVGKSTDEDRYMSDPDYFWEADEEELVMEDLRSRYESDR